MAFEDFNLGGANPAQQGQGPQPLAGGFEEFSLDDQPVDPQAAEQHGQLTWAGEAYNTILAAGTAATTGVEFAGALLELMAPDVGEYLRQKGISGTNYLVDKMSPEYQDALNKSWLDLSSGGAMRDPRAWVAGVAQQIPLMFATGGLGEGFGVGIRAATGISKMAARKVGIVSVASGLGSGEAAAGAGRATDAAEMSEEERLTAMRTAAPVGAVAGAVLGHGVEKLVSGRAGGIVGKALTGASGEFAEEAGTQTGTELGKSKVGLGFDTAAILESGVQGMALGALGGSVLGHVSDAAHEHGEDGEKKKEADKLAADKAEQAAIDAEAGRVRQEEINNLPKQLSYWQGADPSAEGAAPSPKGFVAPASVGADADPAQLDVYKQALKQSDDGLTFLQGAIHTTTDPQQRDMLVGMFRDEQKTKQAVTEKLNQHFPGWDAELTSQQVQPPAAPTPTGPLALPAPQVSPEVPAGQVRPPKVVQGEATSSAAFTPESHAALTDPNDPYTKQINATQVALDKARATVESTTNPGARAKAVGAFRTATRRLEKLTQLQADLAEKQRAAKMAGPVDPTTGLTLGQQQLNLLPERDTSGHPLDRTAQVNADAASLLAALDAAQIPHEGSVPNAGFGEPLSAPTAILDFIEKKVKKSQQAKAAAVARWAKRATPLVDVVGQPPAPTAVGGAGGAEHAAIATRIAMQTPDTPSVQKQKKPTPATEKALPQPTDPAAAPAPPVIPVGVTPAEPMAPAQPQLNSQQVQPAPGAPGSPEWVDAKVASIKQKTATAVGEHTADRAQSRATLNRNAPDMVAAATDLSPPQTAVPTPPAPKVPTKPLAAQTPLERLGAALAKGPQPVDKILAMLQDAHSNQTNKNAPIVRLLTKLRGAFPATAKQPSTVQVVNTPLSAGFQGLYDPKTDKIHVDMAQAEDAITAVLHEAVHAATVVRMRTNPVVRGNIERFMADAADAWNRLGWKPDAADDAPGFASAEEFIAEALTNPIFADRLAALPNIQNPKQNVFQRVKTYLRGMFGFGQDAQVSSAFDDLLAFIPDGALLPDVNRQAVLAAADAHNMSQPVASLASLYRAMLRRNAMSQPGANGTLPSAEGRVWKWTLPLMTVEQIANSYGDIGKAFKDQNGNVIPLKHDSINEFYKLITQKAGFAKAKRATATQIVEYMKNSSDSRGFAPLDNILINARMWSLDPSLPVTDPANVFGINQPGGVDLYADLQRQWGALNIMQRNSFRMVRDSAVASRNDSINQMMIARVRAMAGVAAADRFEAYINDPSRTVRVSHVPGINMDWQRTMTAAEVAAQVNLLGVSSPAKLVTAVNQIQHIMAKSEGPYIPLRRDGDHFMVIRSPVITKTMTKADLDQMISTDRLNPQGGDILLKENNVLPNGMHEVKYTHEVVTAHETAAAAGEALAEEEARFRANGVPVAEAKRALRNNIEHEASGLQAASLEALKREVMAAMPGAAGQQATEQITKFYLERTPDTSAKKAQLRAQKISGASRDMLHVYASYVQGTSYMQAQMRYGHRIARTITASAQEDEKTLRQHRAFDQADDLVSIMNHFRARDTARNDLAMANSQGQYKRIQKLWQRAPQLAGAWLLTGPGTLLTNAMQPMMLSLPHLGARHGFTRTSVSLMQAYKDILPSAARETAGEYGRLVKNTPKALAAISRNAPTPSFKNAAQPFFQSLTQYLPLDEQTAIHELAHAGRIDFGLVADLQSLSNKDGAGWNAISYAADAAFILPQAAETINRVVTALASYRLNKASDPSLTAKELADLAARDVDQTQLNYGAENKPQIMQSNEFLRAALVFKTYPQGIFYTVMRNLGQSIKAKTPQEKLIARKFVAGVFASTALMSGMAGIMAFEPLYWATVALMAAFRDDDDRDPEHLLREATKGWSQDLANAFVKGLPYANGVDTGRMGLPQIFPVSEIQRTMDDPAADSSDWLGVLGEAFVGAPGSLLANIFKGAGHLANGQYNKAAVDLSPKAFGMNDAARAWAYHNSGATDGQDTAYMSAQEIGTKGMIIRALGFEPSEVAAMKEYRNQWYTDQAKTKAERSKLMAQFGQAQLSPTKAGRDLALARITAYNRKNPDKPITVQAIIQSVTGHAWRDYNMEEYGVNATTNADRMAAQELLGEYQ